MCDFLLYKPRFTRTLANFLCLYSHFSSSVNCKPFPPQFYRDSITLYNSLNILINFINFKVYNLVHLNQFHFSESL